MPLFCSIDAQDIRRLVLQCPRLKELGLFGCKRISAADVSFAKEQGVQTVAHETTTASQ